MSGKQDFGDWPTPEEQRRSREQADMRRHQRSMEALAREMRLTREGTATPAIPTDRPSGPEWIALVRAHRATGEPRPNQTDVADRLGMTERTLVKRVRELGIKRWHDVHALVAIEP